MSGRVGVLDSGVGGISIWKEIVKQSPHLSTVYIADSLNCPYGTRTSKEIFLLTERLVEFLLSKKVDIIVLACNTITVTCLEKLRKKYPQVPIVGTVPVIKTAVEFSKNKKIGILSTEVTSKSEYQKNLIKHFAPGLEVVNIGTNLLVPLIEKGDFEKIDEVLPEVLRPFKDRKIDVLALGCSHFPLIRDRIQKHLAGVLLIDSGGAVARQVKRVLGSVSGKSKREFYNTESVTYNFADDILTARESLRDIISFKLIKL